MLISELCSKGLKMDLEADFTEVGEYLSQHLGLKLTAYVCGAKNTRSVNGWKKGKLPGIEVETRVRYAHQVAVFIVEAFGADTAKSWLFGKNRNLKGRAPAWVLRHGKKIEDLKSVVDAAKKFVVA
jgi:hypothetical protein